MLADQAAKAADSVGGRVGAGAVCVALRSPLVPECLVQPGEPSARSRRLIVRLNKASAAWAARVLVVNCSGVCCRKGMAGGQLTLVVRNFVSGFVNTQKGEVAILANFAVFDAVVYEGLVASFGELPGSWSCQCVGFLDIGILGMYSRLVLVVQSK